MLKGLICSLSLLGLVACGKGPDIHTPASELKIYGGTKVTADEAVAKFTVVLMQSKGTVCSGVLIAPRLVLTAGHCYFLVDSHKPIYVGFGLKDKDVKKVQVAHFAPNDKFDAAAGKLGGIDIEVNDISLIELAEDAPTGYAPLPMLQSSDVLSVGEPIVLAGFGKTDVKTGFFGLSTVVGELYEVSTELLLEASAAKEVWMGNVPGKGACNGDSGGPALVVRDGEFKLLGVTSRGRNCRSEYIYTDVRYFQDWIQETASHFTK